MKSNVIKALLACGVCMASVACGSKGGNVEQTAVEEKPKVTTEVVHVEKVDQRIHGQCRGIRREQHNAAVVASYIAPAGGRG